MRVGYKGTVRDFLDNPNWKLAGAVPTQRPFRVQLHPSPANYVHSLQAMSAAVAAE